MDRRWWSDESYKTQLEAKVNTNEWFVSVGSAKDPAKVIKIVYAGYKVEYPNSKSEIINPSKVVVEDINATQYSELKVGFDQRLEEERQRKQAIEDARIALLNKQKACLHVETKTECTLAGAGCDINDTWCLECDKVLRRSWSTAYDRDPDDHVSDWDWWMREHTKLYNVAPKRESYEVVEAIEDYRGNNL